MDVNPVDTPGVKFEFAGMNPNFSCSSTKAGPRFRVSFEVTKEHWDLWATADLKGAIFAGILFRSEDGGTLEHDERQVQIPGSHGEWWRRLIAYGAFNAPPVLNALGTDEGFQAYVKQQPCCLTGSTDVVYAHVRRVNKGAGTGLKPDFSGVPLDSSVHGIQHNNGELAAIEHCRSLGVTRAGSKVETAEDAKEWFDQKAAYYRAEWASDRLKEIFGEESRTQIPPERVINWFREHNLTPYLNNNLMESI